MNKNKLFPRKKLVENLVLLEGITRAGKFLLGNILCGIQDIRHYQYYGLLEHIPVLHRFGLIDDTVAKAVIQCQVDNFVYDHLLGRTVNFRLDDKSSVYNDPRLKEYLYNMNKIDSDDVVKEIQEGKKYYPFIVHDIFSNLNIFFELYPDLKVIHIDRNPVDLIYSWYQRGWGNRYGVDPLEFSLSYQGQSQSIPWFVYESKEEYEQGNEMDRVIISITNIIRMNQWASNKMSFEQDKKILFTSYERLLVDPDVEIERLSKFFDKNILSEMEIIKIQERLPKSHPRLMRKEKIGFIKKNATSRYFQVLMELDKVYGK